MHRRAALIWITMVAATGTVLRLWPIDAHSFWLDEAYSWTMATKFSFSEIVQRTANDFHPPLYYMVLKCWIAVFGESEIAQRMLSVTCDVFTIWMLYVFCRDAFAATNDGDGKCTSRSVGVLAAALYAVNGIHIHWSIETRMYSMATLLSVVSSWLLLRALQSADSVSGKALAAGMLTEDSESNRALAQWHLLWFVWWFVWWTLFLFLVFELHEFCGLGPSWMSLAFVASTGAVGQLVFGCDAKSFGVP